MLTFMLYVVVIPVGLYFIYRGARFVWVRAEVEEKKDELRLEEELADDVRGEFINPDKVDANRSVVDRFNKL